MKARYTLIALLAILIMALGACAAPQAAPTAAPQAAPTAVPQAAPTAVPPTAAPAKATDFVTWFQYDQNNVDPKSDERVGNEWLRNTMPLFNKEFEGKWNWVNQPKAFDKMQAELVAAVQSGGEVPDVFNMGSSSVNVFYANGTMQDLTAWASAQPWFNELDPNGVSTCKGPDGKLYCIPLSERPHLVYVWKDRWPNGFPKTPDEFLTEAARLKKEGLYAMTLFGSTDFEGEGLTRGIFTTLASFGGSLDDGQGHMKLDTPENIAAIEFLRTLVKEGYVPEIAFAGQFQEENAFKDASAASFPTGLFGYRYVNPLTAPNGTKYAKGNENDMLDAIAAGDVYLAPFPAPAGKTPGCNTEADAYGIPTGAKNVDAAHDFINWLVTSGQSVSFTSMSGGFPVLKSAQSDPLFQSPFYKEAGQVLAQEACRPWYGSLQRTAEAQKSVMDTIYKLIKQDPTADIATELQKTQDQYNAGS